MIKPNIFIDMDGVLVDFDEHYKSIDSGNHPSEVDDDSVMWPTIWKHNAPQHWQNPKLNFFGTAPLMPGAKEFISELKKMVDFKILTACPKNHFAQTVIAKKHWIHTHVGTEVQVIPVLGSKNKPLYRQYANDLLVDDFMKCLWGFGKDNAFHLSIVRHQNDVEQGNIAYYNKFKSGGYDEALVAIEEQLKKPAKLFELE